MQITSSDPDAFAVMLISYQSADIVEGIRRACKLDVSTRTVEGWRNGRNLPLIAVLPGIAHGTGLPIADVRLAYSRSALSRKAARAQRKAQTVAAIKTPNSRKRKRAG
jgi:transcriptional regulator with XRE-family HTH domain